MKCGHMYCSDCFEKMRELRDCMNPHDVRCALCREISTREQSYLVTTIRKKPEPPLSSKSSSKATADYDYHQDFDLTGIRMEGNCNSAKVEGVVKCLIKILRIDPDAKCIVFSEHITMLDMIVDLLQANSIRYCLAKDNKSLQKNIDVFRQDPDYNVLLMPYSLGANGLNIIEATHVLLVEPTLNRAQEVQAIGRVHRIGQTKPTFVYRLVI